MPRSRVTVTVRPEVLAAVEAEVAAGRAPSVSAWVDEAMAERARQSDVANLLAEMADEAPATAEDEQWARAALGL